MLEVSWFLFIVASLVLIITPGQDMILVMSRSVAQGAAAGVVTAAGVSVGLVGPPFWPRWAWVRCCAHQSGCFWRSSWWGRHI